MNDAQAFDTQRRALIAACLRVAEPAQRSTFPHARRFTASLRQVAESLETGTWEEQASAAASLRGWSHRDGVADWPDPPGALSWQNDLSIIHNLSTIYVQSSYAEIARARAVR